MNCYQVFGLTIGSELELPELLPVGPSVIPDVRVTFGAVPPLAGGRSVSVRRNEVFLQCEGAGRYRIAGGTAITIDPERNAAEAALRLYLLGSALGAVIHQRGWLPLHANAIVLDGRAIAFAGAPGAGKSTLAAWFHDHGDTLLSDDVCALEERDGDFLAHPGVPRLRLHPDALAATGRRPDDYSDAFDGWAKYVLPTRREPTVDDTPLSHVYVLEEPDGDEVLIERLSGAVAVQALSENTYRGFYVRDSGLAEQHFYQCTELARQVPVFLVRIPRGLERFPSDALRLRDHAQSVLAG